jgi:ATP/maltotriose-dependent transcriptional regulator MalT
VFSIRRRAQLNFYSYIPETDMTKPSDHDVHPRDQLVAEIFDTLDDNLQEAFLERASIIEFDSNLPRAHAECLAMICILNRR